MFIYRQLCVQHSHGAHRACGGLSATISCGFGTLGTHLCLAPLEGHSGSVLDSEGAEVADPEPSSCILYLWWHRNAQGCSGMNRDAQGCIEI